MFYQKIIRPILFKIYPERIHHIVIAILSVISSLPIIYSLIRRKLFISEPILQTKIGNLFFKNPIGLAAGFDKDITAPLAYPMLGFGYTELGSVTYSAQAGNPKPRLWRIPADSGLIVYYGLCNRGVLAAIKQLKKIKTHLVPYGLSIAPTTGLKLEEMADDYLKSFVLLAPLADYITLNVSCPNVANNDLFSQISFIRELTHKVDEFKKANNLAVDIFLKIGPDMEKEQYEEIVEICVSSGITAIIATNLIKKRDQIRANSAVEKLNHPGGISGKLLAQKSNEVIKILYRAARGRLKIIGVGGVFCAADAYGKIKSGASAIQLITGFIYGGPLTIRQINLELAKLLQADGFRNVDEAVGKENLI